MHADQPSSESVDQAVSTSDEQQQGQLRTYECTFCKRGFTNAQALGGHMNIHRKDKAKLKQASNETTQQFREIPKPYLSTASNTLQALQEIKSSQEKSPRNWPAWNFSSEDQDFNPIDETQMVQLPLFSETTSRNIENQEVTSRPAAITETGFSSDHGSSEPELDLELRLGHEFKESSATPSTRKFF